MTPIDAVVRAAMLPEEIADIVKRMDPGDDEVVHSTASAGGHDLGVLSAFKTCQAGDIEFLGASGLYLAPGIIYRSALTMTLTMSGTTVTTTGSASLELAGRHFPHTIIAALVGRHVSAVVEHPALSDPRLVIVDSHEDRMTMAKSRSGPRKPPGDPMTPGFTVLLPQILDILT